MPPTAAALLLAIPMILLGIVSGWFQIAGMRALAIRAHVPSDERAYLRGRHRRRLLAAGLMLAAGALIAAAYLGGLEDRADALSRPAADGTKKVHDDDDRQFVRLYGIYWIAVISLAFTLVGVACQDAWSTRRYWLGVYRQISEDHQVKLRRDLAMHKAQHERRKAAARGPHDADAD